MDRAGRTGTISPWNNLLMLCTSGLEETAWKAILIIKEGHRTIFLRGRKKNKHYVTFFVENKVTGASVTVKELDDRRQFFMENNLRFNCGRSGYRPHQCRNQGCLKCKYKHYISICDKEERENSKPNEILLTGYTTYAHRGEDTTPYSSR